MQESEQALTRANISFNDAKSALENSYSSLENIQMPDSGSMADFLATRTLVSSQRGIIDHNKEWVNYAKNQLANAKEQLKKDMIEYEKYKYLELEEIKKIIKKQKQKESKDLDEIALITFARKDER